MYLNKLGLIAGASMLAHFAEAETYDLRNFDTWLDVDENGITLIEGETTDVILFENQSTGYEWIYDTSDSNDIYTVDSF